MNWTPLEESCIGMHPQDIALNHADLFRGMSALNKGQMEDGQAFIMRHLEENPRSIPAIKILQKIKGESNDAETVCRVLGAKLEAAKADR